jgi:16S rRNA (uracil1498-N3)-methyltransferase
VRRVVVPTGSVVGERASLTGAPHHHLGHVLRLTPGVRLLLVEEGGPQHLARVEQITASEVRLVVEEHLGAGPSPRPRLTLLYGLSRRVRTEWVLQKATELGVDALQLCLCERSVSHVDASERRLERWQEIMRQAARQSGRELLPCLGPPLPFADALAAVGAAELRLVARIDGAPPSELQERLATASEAVAVAVGPEGGFSPRELQQAEAAGFLGIRLGPTTLRTETAALVALALTALLTGRMG